MADDRALVDHKKDFVLMVITGMVAMWSGEERTREQAAGLRGGKVQSRKACWPPGPGGAEGERRRGWILEDDEVVWTRPGEMGGGGRGSLSLQI